MERNPALANQEDSPALADRRADLDSLLELRDRAFSLAVRTLGVAEGAEDAVQQAYVDALRDLAAGARPRDLTAWFLGSVVHSALHLARSEKRRRRREAGVEDRMMADRFGPGGRAELAEALTGCLAALDERHRVAISLCYEQGLTQKQAAEALGVPIGTISTDVNRGLEMLRSALGRAGYSAAPAAIAGALAAAPQLTAPAGLAAAIQGIMQAGALSAMTAARAGAGATLKISARLGAKKAAGLALGWKIAAVAGIVAAGGVAAPLVYNAGPGRPGAVAPVGDFDLAAAAAKCRTVADLRALAPHIRAASEKMLADPNFDPERVIGLEFADVAARRAQGDWEVPAAAVAVRLALSSDPKEVPPAEEALGPEWRTALAGACRLRHDGRHREALEAVRALHRSSQREPAVIASRRGEIHAVAFWLAYLDDPAAGGKYGYPFYPEPGSDVMVLSALSELQVSQNSVGVAGRLAALWIVGHSVESLPEDDRLRKALLGWLKSKFSRRDPPVPLECNLFCPPAPGTGALKTQLAPEAQSAAKQITDRLALVLGRDQR